MYFHLFLKLSYRYFFVLLLLGVVSGIRAQERNWKSGIELGTGLSFTGYNANLAYRGTWGKNVIYLGPKLVYSDANALFDAPWGGQAGYRRLFPINERLVATASLEYQFILFDYAGRDTDALNSIHEAHFSYGLEFFLSKHWSIGNTIGGGAYIERLVDPFDGRVDQFSGYSTHFRIYTAYHFL